MQSKSINISVIIPTLNRLADLKKTLDSIYRNNYIPNEVIVIDQSEASNFHYLSSYPNLIYQRVDFKSLTKARNCGLRIAKNEIIIFCDDDVEVINPTFELIFKKMTDTKIALLGTYNNLEKIKFSSCLNIFLLKKSLFKVFKGHVTNSFYGSFPLIKKNVETEWAMGFFL